MADLVPNLRKFPHKSKFYLGVVDLAAMDISLKPRQDDDPYDPNAWPGDKQPYYPIPIMGPHRAWFVGESITLDASNSYGFKGHAVSLSWTSWVYTISLGIQSVSLIVTDMETGAQTTTTRYIWGYMRPENTGPLTEHYAPYTHFEILSCTGTLEGGWRARLRVYKGGNLAAFPDGALVIIFADDWYGMKDFDTGEVKASHGGYAGATEVVLEGFCQNATIIGDEEIMGGSYVEFDVVSLDELMRQQWALTAALPFTCVPKTQDPTSFHEFYDMTLEDIIAHYIRKHTNITDFHDVFIKHCDQKYLMAADITEGSMYEVLSQLASSFFGLVSGNRYGGLIIRKDPQLMFANELAAWPTSQYDFEDQDILRNVEWQEQLAQTIAFVEVAGATGDLVWVLGNYPPGGPVGPGSFESVQGVLLQNDEEAQAYAEAIFNKRNIRIPGLTLHTFNNRMVDPGHLYSQFRLTLPADFTQRNRAFAEEKFMATQVDYRFNHEAGYLLVDVTGVQAVTGVSYIPTEYDTWEFIAQVGALSIPPGGLFVTYLLTDEKLWQLTPTAAIELAKLPTPMTGGCVVGSTIYLISPTTVWKYSSGQIVQVANVLAAMGSGIDIAAGNGQVWVLHDTGIGRLDPGAETVIAQDYTTTTLGTGLRIVATEVGVLGCFSQGDVFYRFNDPAKIWKPVALWTAQHIQAAAVSGTFYGAAEAGVIEVLSTGEPSWGALADIGEEVTGLSIGFAATLKGTVYTLPGGSIHFKPRVAGLTPRLNQTGDYLVYRGGRIFKRVS